MKTKNRKPSKVERRAIETSLEEIENRLYVVAALVNPREEPEKDVLTRLAVAILCELADHVDAIKSDLVRGDLGLATLDPDYHEVAPADAIAAMRRLLAERDALNDTANAVLLPYLADVAGRRTAAVSRRLCWEVRSDMSAAREVTTPAPAAPAASRRFAALRNRDCRPYLFGAAMAMMADNIEHVITYWVLWERFHSPALSGFQVISHWVPFLLFSVYSGALADRFDCRRVIQVGQALFMLASVGWGVLLLTDSLQIWSACVLLVVASWCAALVGGASLTVASTAAWAGVVLLAMGVAAYLHSLAVASDGDLYSWGADPFGQLANGASGEASVPVQVLTGVAAAAAGVTHTAIVKTDGTVWGAGAAAGIFEVLAQLEDVALEVAEVQVEGDGRKPGRLGLSHAVEGGGHASLGRDHVGPAFQHGQGHARGRGRRHGDEIRARGDLGRRIPA